MRLTKLSDIFNRARDRKSRRLVVAVAEDRYVLQAVIRAKTENIIEPVLVGNTSKILDICDEHRIEIENIPLIKGPGKGLPACC